MQVSVAKEMLYKSMLEDIFSALDEFEIDIAEFSDIGDRIDIENSIVWVIDHKKFTKAESACVMTLMLDDYPDPMDYDDLIDCYRNYVRYDLPEILTAIFIKEHDLVY